MCLFLLSDKGFFYSNKIIIIRVRSRSPSGR